MTKEKKKKKRSKNEFLLDWEHPYVLNKRGMRLKVTQPFLAEHDDPAYYFTCNEVGVSAYALTSTNLKDVEIEALNVVIGRLRELATSLAVDVENLQK